MFDIDADQICVIERTNDRLFGDKFGKTSRWVFSILSLRAQILKRDANFKERRDILKY